MRNASRKDGYVNDDGFGLVYDNPGWAPTPFMIIIRVGYAR